MDLTRYAHGLGFGDINGDGRNDIIQSKGWWRLESIDGDPLWIHHTWPFELDGAQMLVYDVDGDEDNDIVTAIASHGYGIAWLEHTKTKMEISPSRCIGSSMKNLKKPLWSEVFSTPRF